MTGPVLLVMAKAPVPGGVKTRLGVTVGMVAAAEVAAAALLDTLAAGAAAFAHGDRHLALAGDLAGAARGDALSESLDGWVVHPQRGVGFGARLANAHEDAARRTSEAVVQIGMDTPQVDASLLRDAVAGLADSDAVVGPCEDGGWWVLAVRRAADARGLEEVEMSTTHTCDDTISMLRASGLSVGTCARLRDIDTAADADAVSLLAPGTRFARMWRSLDSGRTRGR